MGGFRFLDDKPPARTRLHQRRRFGNAVATRMGEDEVGRIGKAWRLGFEPGGRKGHQRHGEMPRDGLHGRLLGAHVQRRDEGDVLRVRNDGGGERDELSGGRAAFAAEAKDERSSSGIRGWGFGAHERSLAKFHAKEPGLAVSDSSG